VTRILFALSALILFTASPLVAAQAQEAKPSSNLQVEAQNPVSSLISVPVQQNLYFGGIYGSEPLSVTNVQPVVPFSFDDRWNVILRPIVPIVSSPGLAPGMGRETGLGDTTIEAFVSPSQSFETAFGAVALGVGGALTVPTHTDQLLGSRNYSAGPAIAAFVEKRMVTYGFLAVNQWSFAGPENEPATNELTFQPFLNYNLPKGWSIGSAPVITVDWTAAGDNVTLPVGGGVSKLMTVGEQPLRVGIDGYYNALRPDEAPEWQVQLGVTLLFPE